jgi:CDP-glycerol glycerophosphotransferase (TagB/SpsB family)
MGQNNYGVENLIMHIKKTIRYTIQQLYKFIYQSSYAIMAKYRPINEKKVVISLFRSNKLEGNLKAFYNEVKKLHPELEIHFIHPCNKISYGLFKEIPYFCDAKYIILDDYYLPVYLINPRKETRIVQLWHAAGAFKKFGYSTIGTKFGSDRKYLEIVPIHSNYTHVYVSSEKVIPQYAEAFNMPKDKIYPLGIPRIDFFSDEFYVKEKQQKITKSLTIEQQKKTKILIAPTYRANALQRETELDFAVELTNILKDIDSDKLLIFVPHPYVDKNELEPLVDLQHKHPEQIIIGENFSTNEWMLVADAFITDYSSAIFEFALLKKPLAHYVPDLAEYQKNRGFYNNIENISDGMILTNPKQLFHWINERSTGEFYNTDRMIQYNFSVTSNITKGIIDHLMN